MPYSTDHKAKSKERILQSATNLFCRYGFEKVSISQVMKLAKMTHGAFYSHFESKEALYKAAFHEAMRRSRATHLMKGPFSVQNLKELVTGYLNVRDLTSNNTPSTEAFLSNDIGIENSEIKKLYEESYLGLVKLFENRLNALTRMKKISLTPNGMSIQDKARAILASMIGAIAIAKSIDQEAEREAVLLAAQRQIYLMLGMDESELYSK
ncbi:MAG: TetR/AcrR family transcriptional regulator [Gammaproteobacteria bacterium]|nr:TetR/AcrR family transcriptional regulator [Gammaproteobacteria bacterium]